MKKGPRIIQISGIRGLLFIGFVTTCLCAGFIAFPARVAMFGWNYIASNYYIVPPINIWQGLMLWAIIAGSTFLLTKGQRTILFKQPMELSDSEMRILMERIKMQKQAQKLSSMIIKAKDLELSAKEHSKVQEKNQDNTSNNANEKQL